MIKAIIFDWGRTLWDNENGVLFQDSKETLEYLKKKGYRLALLSVTENTAAELKLQRIRESKLEPLFDKIVFCEEKGSAEAEGINRIWSLPYDSIMVVGDRTKADIKVASLVGAKSVWLQRGKFAEELPDKETGTPTYIISTVSELKSFL